MKNKNHWVSVNFISVWPCTSLLIISLIRLLATVSSLRTSLVGFLHNWIVKIFKLFLFAFKLVYLAIKMRWDPVLSFWYFAQNHSFVFLADFSLHFLIIYCMFDANAVAFEAIFRLYFPFNFLILIFVLLSIFDQFFNLFFRKPSFIVCNGNFSVLWGLFIEGCNIHNAIFVNFKGYLNLRDSSWSWYNSVKIEVSKFVVVLSHRSLTLKDLNCDPWLIVSISCENLWLFSWNCCVSLDEFCHDSACSLNAKWKWSDIQKNTWVNCFITVTFQDSSLNCCSICYCLIWIYWSVWLFSIKVLFQKLNDFRDSCWSSNQDNIVDLILTHTWIFHDFFNWRDGLFEHVYAQLLEFSSGEGQSKVLGLGQRIHLDGGLSRWAENPLCLLTLSPQSSQGSSIALDINSLFLVELGYTIFYYFVIKVLTSQMGISSSGFNLENAIVDG